MEQRNLCKKFHYDFDNEPTYACDACYGRQDHCQFFTQHLGFDNLVRCAWAQVGMPCKNKDAVKERENIERQKTYI